MRGVPEEFVRLFFIRFPGQWPKGVPLPDAVAGSRIAERLAWRCVDALRPFQQHVKKRPGARDSAGAVALLPVELIQRGRHPTADGMREGAERLLGQGEAAVVGADRLMALEGDGSGQGDRDPFGVVALLGRLGYLVEPDPRMSSRQEQTLVLFRAGEGKPGPLSPLGRDVATLGGVVLRALSEQDARDALESSAWALVVTVAGIPASELARAEARVRWLLATGRSGSGLGARLGRLDEGKRRRLAETLAGLVPRTFATSGPALEAMVRAWGLLGFSSDDAYMALHDRALGRPITPRSGPETAGLDRGRIAATRRETEAASSLLARHLAEEEEAPPPRSPGGLDPSHAAFLTDLAVRPRWRAEELEALAAGHGLMPQAALDRINEAALEAWGEPLMEGEDPLDVHPRAKELT
ncbi:MAG: hypothetical protein M3Q23_03730 [Actinomycetota bacterium]|nr:hypothetical protein [Actinomycetota bacterium]